MNIVSHKHWESLEKMNQVLIQRWEVLQHARKKGKRKEIIEAEMQYLSALQIGVYQVRIALSLPDWFG